MDIEILGSSINGHRQYDEEPYRRPKKFYDYKPTENPPVVSSATALKLFEENMRRIREQRAKGKPQS